MLSLFGLSGGGKKSKRKSVKKSKRKSIKKSNPKNKKKSRRKSKPKRKSNQKKKSKPKRKSYHKKKSKRKRKSVKPKKSLGKGGSMENVLRNYERACKRAENSNKANPSDSSNDCGSMRYHVSTGRMTKSKIETYTRMHLLALKIGSDAYHIKREDINAAYKAEFGTLKI
jgi:hypothetical protein